MKRMFVISALLLLPIMLSAQEKKAPADKLKTETVYEQKWEKGVAGKVLIESVTQYDQAGNVIERIEYKAGKIDEHYVFKYDDANNKVQETELDPSGKKVKVTVYVYNNGLRTERTVYDGSNHVVSKKTYKYETF